MEFVIYPRPVVSPDFFAAKYYNPYNIVGCGEVSQHWLTKSTCRVWTDRKRKSSHKRDKPDANTYKSANYPPKNY